MLLYFYNISRPLQTSVLVFFGFAAHKVLLEHDCLYFFSSSDMAVKWRKLLIVPFLFSEITSVCPWCENPDCTSGHHFSPK